MELADQIKKIIHESVADATVHIHDPDSQHLEAIVISDAFVGLPLLQRSRNIMKALHTFFDTDLHALKLQTYTQEEWKTRDRI